ncbi:unnamed protein product [Rhizophagus irregularis]|nr:unnamed protein product [Rhizophagus irregularis]
MKYLSKILNSRIMVQPPNYKVLFSKEDSKIIVLRPEINKYLSWVLATPQQIADLIKQKSIKAPASSYMIFKLDCTAAILDSQGFVEDFSEREIAKTIVAIWNNTTEYVKDEYKKLNRNVQMLQNLSSNKRSNVNAIEYEEIPSLSEPSSYRNCWMTIEKPDISNKYVNNHNYQQSISNVASNHNVTTSDNEHTLNTQQFSSYTIPNNNVTISELKYHFVMVNAQECLYGKYPTADARVEVKRTDVCGKQDCVPTILYHTSVCNLQIVAKELVEKYDSIAESILANVEDFDDAENSKSATSTSPSQNCDKTRMKSQENMEISPTSTSPSQNCDKTRMKSQENMEISPTSTSPSQNCDKTQMKSQENMEISPTSSPSQNYDKTQMKSQENMEISPHFRHHQYIFLMLKHFNYFFIEISYLLRDFTLEGPESFKDYFLEKLNNVNPEAAKGIRKNFSDLDVYGLPHPGCKRKMLQHMEDAITDDLDEEFVEVENDVKLIYSQLPLKYIGSSTMKGTAFVKFLNDLVERKNKSENSAFLSIPSKYESIIHFVAQKAVKEHIRIYQDQVEHVVNEEGKLPILWNEFTEIRNNFISEANKIFFEKIIEMENFIEQLNGRIQKFKGEFTKRDSDELMAYNKNIAKEYWEKFVKFGLNQEILFESTEKLQDALKAIAKMEELQANIDQQNKSHEEMKERLIKERDINKSHEGMKERLIKENKSHEEMKERLIKERDIAAEKYNQKLEQLHNEMLEQQRLSEEEKIRLLEQRLSEEEKIRLLEQQRLSEEEKIRFLKQQEAKFEQIQREAEKGNKELKAQLFLLKKTIEIQQKEQKERLYKFIIQIVFCILVIINDFFSKKNNLNFARYKIMRRKYNLNFKQNRKAALKAQNQKDELRKPANNPQTRKPANKMVHYSKTKYLNFIRYKIMKIMRRKYNLNSKQKRKAAR